MTLRKKTLLIVGLTIVGLIAILSAVSATILMGGFNDLEQQDTVPQHRTRRGGTE